MSERDAAFRKFKKSKQMSDWENFKKLRNKAKFRIRTSFRNYINDNYNPLDTRKFWNIIKERGGGKHKQDNNINDEIDLDELNNFFCINKSPSDKSNILSYYKNMKKHDSSQLYIKPPEIKDVQSALREIKSGAVGEDAISLRMLLLLEEDVLPLLLQIFNTAIESSTYPTLWKAASIMPVKKKPVPKAVNDFRAINILCVQGKLFDKIIYRQLSDFVSKNNLLSPYQSGYRKGFSTETALVRVLDDVRKAMDNRMVTLMVMVDFSRAFDCVEHELLLAILESINISENTLKLFESYLSGRKQRIRTKNAHLSAWSEVHRGVPQGSTLSALLFAIFINDITNIFERALYMLYADDLQLYLSCDLENLAHIILFMNVELKRLSEWCTSHDLQLNASKCAYMIIGNPRLLNQIDRSKLPSVEINGIPLSEAQEMKNLGLIIDSTLSWNKQTEYVCKKIYQGLYQIKNMNCYPNICLRKLLINSLLFPYIDYAAAAYPDIGIMNMKCLQRAQNAAIRYIYDLPIDEHITPYYAQLGWLKVRERRLLKTATLAYSVLKHRNPPYLASEFTRTTDIHHIDTRLCKDTFRIPQHKTEKFSNSFLITSTRMLNSFTTDLNFSKSVKNFKKQVEEKLQKLCF